MLLLLEGSAWRPSARRPSGGLLLRALGCVAGRRLFAGAPALPAGLSVGAGRGVGPARIWAQPPLLLLCFSPLVFFLSLPGSKAKEEEEKN